MQQLTVHYVDDPCSAPSTRTCLVHSQAPITICSSKSKTTHSQRFITRTAGFPNQSSGITLTMHKLTERSLPEPSRTVSAVNCCQRLLLWVQTGLCFDLKRYRTNWAHIQSALTFFSLKLKASLGVPFETYKNAPLTSAAHQSAVDIGGPPYGTCTSLATYKVHPQYLGRCIHWSQSCLAPFWTSWCCISSPPVAASPRSLVIGLQCKLSCGFIKLSVLVSSWMFSELNIRWVGFF